jgi:hypothetical protein
MLKAGVVDECGDIDGTEDIGYFGAFLGKLEGYMGKGNTSRLNMQSNSASSGHFLLSTSF